MKNKYFIEKSLKYSFIDNLKKLPFIDEIWLFGSRARGDNNPKSDIDIAIVCPNSSKSDWNQVLEILENADTLLKIDCIKFDKESISTELFENILKDRKIIYVKS